MFVLIFLLQAVSAAGDGGGSQAALSQIAVQYESFQEEVEESRRLTHEARATSVATLFAARFGELVRSDLRFVEAHDLELLYRAAGTAVFYSFRRDLVHEMERLLEELERRDLASGGHFASLHRSYISMRMFDPARRLAAARPDLGLEAVPELRGEIAAGARAEVPTTWALNGGAGRLVRESAELRGQSVVIVIAHPSCHFSETAAEAIEEDSILRAVFEQGSLWLVPPGGSLDLDLVQGWNETRPQLSLKLVGEHGEWPMIDTWDTPTFYFLDDGVVASKVVGWPREGRREELLAGARLIGLPRRPAAAGADGRKAP